MDDLNALVGCLLIRIVELQQVLIASNLAVYVEEDGLYGIEERVCDRGD